MHSFRAFIKKSICFAIVLVLVLVMLDIVSMLPVAGRYMAYLTNSYDYIVSGPGQIIPCIEKAKSKDDTAILLTGDSVFSQMFGGLAEDHKNISIIGANGGITSAGQYVIVHEYLNNHPEATAVYLELNPVSMCRTFDNDFGYQYAVEPLVYTDTLHLLEEDTIEAVRQIYGAPFVNKAVCTILDNSGINKKLYLNYLKANDRYMRMDNAFELSDKYIIKIKKLCEDRGVDFYLLTGPVTYGWKAEVERVYEDYKQSELGEVYPELLDNIYYIDDAETIDGTHFGGEYACQDNYNEKIRAIYKDTPLVDMLF